MSKKPARRPTIKDVANSAGVSTATVSRVINNTGPVAKGTADHVWQVIEELNYSPNVAAKGLASQRTNTVGLLLPMIGGSFFAPMLNGIELGVREEDFNLLIYTSRELESSSRKISPVGEHNTDGLILFTSTLEKKELTRLNQAGFPMVLMHQNPPPHLNIPIVTFKNKDGTRKLIDHLIEVHDCRRIAILQGPSDHEDSYWREMGYRESLEAHGIPFDPTLVGQGDFEADASREAVQNWLAEGVEMDAIFAGDDDAASGAMQALRRAGIYVPQDIALVGFDDVMISRYLTPPLTTVRAPIESAGYEATRQLIRLIKGQSAEPLTLLPTELIIRQSCGCEWS